MQIPHEKLDGLDRERLLSLVEPVLRVHSVDPVAMVWGRDHRGRVLEITVEKPGATDPGAGVTLDLCAEISRDLSAALDVADLMPSAYRLEVGSPGVERPLYVLGDYERFTGQTAKLKLREAVEGQFVLRGALRGVVDGRVRIDTDWGEQLVDFESIEAGQLVFEFGAKQLEGGRHKRGGRRRRAGARKSAAQRGSR